VEDSAEPHESRRGLFRAHETPKLSERYWRIVGNFMERAGVENRAGGGFAPAVSLSFHWKAGLIGFEQLHGYHRTPTTTASGYLRLWKTG
jgi:hypothetical protein